MNEELIGMFIAFIVGIFMLVLTRSSLYLEVGANVLVSFLLLFLLVMIGLGVVKLFKKLDKEKKKKKNSNFPGGRK